VLFRSNNNLVAVDPTFGGINFTNDGTAGKTNAFTLSGSRITLGGNISSTNVTTGPAITDTIDLDIILSANRVLSPGTNHNIMISGDISETGSGRALTLNRNSTVILTGANTFSGAMNIQQGTIQISSIADFGTASSVGTGGSGAHIVIGSANSTATLLYTGGAQTTNRTIQIHNSGNTGTGGARIINDGTGALTFDAIIFNNAYTNANVVNRALTLGGTNDGSITGIIQNTSATNTNSVVKEGDATWTLGGVNTYTGNTTVSAGTLTLASNSSTQFAIGASGVNNAVLGTGTVNLNGTFFFDLANAGTNDGDFWNIVSVGTLTESYGSLFDVDSTFGSFTDNAGVWSLVDGNNTWTFTEGTGVLGLAVIPEPSAALLGGLGLLALLRRRR
jgi:autotransporter-associated beta strand protein